MIYYEYHANMFDVQRTGHKMPKMPRHSKKPDVLLLLYTTKETNFEVHEAKSYSIIDGILCQSIALQHDEKIRIRFFT